MVHWICDDLWQSFSPQQVKEVPWLSGGKTPYPLLSVAAVTSTAANEDSIMAFPAYCYYSAPARVLCSTAPIEGMVTAAMI
jgi:hypothetical protein